MAIATLTIDLVAKMANIERDMGKAAQIAQKNADKMQKAFAGVNKAVAAIGATVSVGAFASMVKGVADSADALSKLSQRTGVAVEDLSRLQYAASLNDVTTEQLSGGLSKLAKAMADTAAGTGEARSAFEALGLTQDIQAGKFKTAGDLFAVVADRLSQYSDGANKAAIAQKIFGESGAQLIPLLNAGADGLRDMGDEAERLGVVISGELAARSAEFNDNMTRLQVLTKGVAVEISGPLISALVDLSSEFLDARAAGLSFAEALYGIGLSDPGKGPADQIARITKELETLRSGAWYEKSLFGNIAGDKMIAQLEKELDYWRRQLDRTDNRDPRDRASPPARQDAPGLAVPPSASRAKASAAKSPALRSFEDYDAKIMQAVAGAITDNDVTRAADLAAQVQKLDDLYFNAGLSAEIYDAAMKKLTGSTTEISERLGTDVPKAAKDASDAMSEFTKNFAASAQGTLADLLFIGAEEGFDGLADNFARTLQRMAAEAAAAKIMENLFGASFGESGKIDAASIIGKIGTLMSFDGGGYTGNGPRSGGIDGKGGRLSILHPRETIIDHTKGQRAAGTTIVQHITVNGGSAPDVRRSAGQGAREALSVMSGAQRYS